MVEGAHGILVVNKPPGMTSHDVVQVIRQKLGIRRIGHAGTLDPMAEGVLVLLIGGATKHQRAVQTHRKQYEATVRLGIQTDTGDAWGHALHTAAVPALTRERIAAALASCVGPLIQRPPAFSAVKVQGRPMYWWARRGRRLVAPLRTVEIFALELLGFGADWVRCRIECSAGTYIRSLAETLAERLGTLGHMSELVRLSVGSWHLADARDLCWLITAPIEEVWACVQTVDGVHACADRT